MKTATLAAPRRLVVAALGALAVLGFVPAAALAQIDYDPLPAVLVGMGVAWLMVSGERAAHRTEHGREHQDHGAVGERLSGAASATRSAAAHAVDATRSAAGQLASSDAPST